MTLNISNLPIRQDEDGRFSLNDLHKASGNLAKHKPSEYLRNQQAKDLVSEIELEAVNPAIKIIKGRGLTGTYACKELVYAYAMWISPAFTLKVIRAYDSLSSVQYGLKTLPEAKTKKALAGGLSLDQQDTIKALVKSRAEGLPKDKQAGAIIKQWSAIKKKYGMSYKEVAPENFVNIISLITRLPIEGELVEKPSIPTDTIAISLNGGTGAMNIIFNGANDNAAQDYYVKICRSEVSITKLCNERFKTTEEIIADLVEDGYIVMKKADLLGRLQA